MSYYILAIVRDGRVLSVHDKIYSDVNIARRALDTKKANGKLNAAHEVYEVKRFELIEQ